MTSVLFLSIDEGGVLAGGWTGNRYYGDDTDEKVTGTAADELIFGRDGDDTLKGGGGDDVIDGGDGHDVIDGGAGDDTLLFEVRDEGPLRFVHSEKTFDVTVGGATVDTVTSIENYAIESYTDDDLIRTGAGDDDIYGGGGADTIASGAGDDRVEVELGAFKANGGDGLDVFVIDLSERKKAVDLTLSDDMKIGGGTARNFEQFIVDGSGKTDTIRGGDRNDTIDGGGGHDRLFGGKGDDNLSGDSGDDRLSGGAGDDFIEGDSGADRIDGGMGEDTVRITLDEGVDRVSGGKGEDVLEIRVDLAGPLGAQQLTSRMVGGELEIALGGRELVEHQGFEHFSIVGGAAADSLLGGTGDDYLRGEGGRDTLDGGAGVDAYGASGTQGVSVTLAGSNLANVTAGGVVVDAIRNFENVFGTIHNDTIAGDAGDNLIAGGFGDDRVTGGAGDDVFAIVVSGSLDTITDFKVGEDMIELVGLGSIKDGPLPETAFHIGTTAADASDRIIYDPGAGRLFYDHDGAGGEAARQIAQLGRNLDLSADDFLVG